MVKKVNMYAKKVSVRYDPHSNPVCVCVLGGGGVITPKSLSKVDKYVTMYYFDS